jgi:hypothetical protein
MDSNPRIPDAAGLRRVERVRACVPEEVTALRGRLEQLRAEGHSPHTLVAIDRVSAALDALVTALIQDTLGEPTAYRRGHR